MSLIIGKSEKLRNFVLSAALVLTVLSAADALLALHISAKHLENNKTYSCSPSSDCCDKSEDQESKEQCPTCRKFFTCGKYFNITPQSCELINNQQALTAVLDVYEPLKSESYLAFTIRPPPILSFC